MQYKIFPPREHVLDYIGTPFTSVERPVQRLIVLVPSDDHNSSKSIAKVAGPECKSTVSTSD